MFERPLIQRPNPTTTPSRTAVLQRKCACGGAAPDSIVDRQQLQEKREVMLQRRAIGPEPNQVPEIVREVLHSHGLPLDATTRELMESRFGHDFRKVRVHTDAEASESAQAIHARAYTAGENIVFAHSFYDPSTNRGQRLLAHELTHVIQQEAGVSGSSWVSSSGDVCELQADEIADDVMRGAPVRRRLENAKNHGGVTYPAVQLDNDEAAGRERTAEEVEALISRIIGAIAQNESGGAAVARPSRMRTAAGVPASYASSTQMVPAHAVGVLRGAGHAYAARFRLTQDDLRRADAIMHASQRIWDAVVIEGRNIHELSERDLQLTGFTLDELTRMSRFAEVRRLLRAQGDRFQAIQRAVVLFLEGEAVRITEQIERLQSAQTTSEPAIDQTSAGSEDQNGDVSTESIQREAHLAESALDELSGTRSAQSIDPIRSFTLPDPWARWPLRRRITWLDRQLARVRRARGQIERASVLAAEALLARQLSANEHIQALGLQAADVRAYIHGGRFNRFPEDRQAWNRIALQHNMEEGSQQVGESVRESRTLDQAIAEATESGGGWALSRIEYETWIRNWISQHQHASDEQVVRAAAAHNGRSSDYPDKIWGHFQRLRRDSSRDD